MTHLSADQLDRFARGDLDDRELAEVLLHLETCDVCGRAGEAKAAHDLRPLREELLGTPPSPRRTWPWVAAAAAAAAVVLAALLLMRRDEAAPRVQPAPPVAQERQPQTQSQPAPAPPAPEPQKTVEAYDDPEWQRLVARALESGTLPFPADLAVLHAPADTVRGTTELMERVAPAGVVIDDARPTFTWPARGGGAYTVLVFDDSREVIRSAPLSRARWTPHRDLPRGRTLAWQVEVARGGAIETIPRPPAPPALFRIAAASHHRDLQRARARHGNNPLLLSVLYARAGMRKEALAALHRAAETTAAAKRILDHETSSSH